MGSRFFFLFFFCSSSLKIFQPIEINSTIFTLGSEKTDTILSYTRLNAQYKITSTTANVNFIFFYFLICLWSTPYGRWTTTYREKKNFLHDDSENFLKQNVCVRESSSINKTIVFGLRLQRQLARDIAEKREPRRVPVTRCTHEISYTINCQMQWKPFAAFTYASLSRYVWILHQNKLSGLLSANYRLAKLSIYSQINFEEFYSWKLCIFGGNLADAATYSNPIGDRP